MQESLAPAMSDVGLLLLALDEKFNNTGLLHRIDLIEIGWRTLRLKDVGGFYCNLIISRTSILASVLWGAFKQCYGKTWDTLEILGDGFLEMDGHWWTSGGHPNS